MGERDTRRTFLPWTQRYFLAEAEAHIEMGVERWSDPKICGLIAIKWLKKAVAWSPVAADASRSKVGGSRESLTASGRRPEGGSLVERAALFVARDLREFADALDKDRGHTKSRLTALMRDAADEIDALRAEIENGPKEKLEPPYCQVVGQNAAVLLTREAVERIASDYGDYPADADLPSYISGEMRRALIELDIHAKASADA